MNFKHTLVGLTLACTAFSASATLASDAYEMWPGTSYNKSIPTHDQVLGYSVGDTITSHSEMLRFMETLQRAAPDRMKIIEYGRTWEGRKLVYIAIGNPENIAGLAKLSADMKKLANPAVTNKTQAQEMAAKMPGSVWLTYGVHGNEISSMDAAMMTAYHLLAAPDEATNKKILDNTVVFIDPAQNPDGRDRFTTRYYSTAGMEHSTDRLSAEQNEPWPNGRTNHYLFDMNRDWLPLTQPESKGRIKAINNYLPLVVIDLHEMYGDQSYYFPPAAQPFNPHMTAQQIDNMTEIGKNNGKHFDRFGFDYFTREIFDNFYPGYGSAWPVYYGASAATYEVSSSRGEKFRKSTGEIMTYKNTVQKHFVASISTAEAVANTREKLLGDFYNYQVSAIAEGKANKKERVFIMPNIRDKAGNHRLATLMAEHGLDVRQADKSFKACGVNYSKGAYYIDTAQPRGRFVKTTFTKQVDMSDAFLKEQERRRARKLDHEIYDVSAWSLPQMFNIDTNTCGSEIKVASSKVNSGDKMQGKVTNPDASVAYIVPWGDMAAGRFLTAALRAGLTVKSADKAFTLDGKVKYPAGSLIIERRSNANDLTSKIASLATSSGATVDGTNTSWVTDGPSFGSDNVVTMVAPKIAMAWDAPTSSLSAGNSRFVIERQFNYPVTAIRTPMLRKADLSAYQVLILPAGNYKATLGKDGAANLKKWVEGGGVLITLGSATKYAADADYDLLNVKRENAFKESDDKKPANKKSGGGKEAEKKSTVTGKLYAKKSDMIKAIENDEESPDRMAGILANVEVDQEHWLTAGVNENVISLVSGRDIYTPIKLASGMNVAWFKDEKSLLASGYLWAENKKQLAFKPFLIHQPAGRGMVISFTQDPTTRAYLDGLNVMLMNTIFRASAHAKPVR